MRIIDQVVETIYIQPLLKTYKKEGNPSYHPKMLLKVMLYAYMTNIYSSRRIELALGENINFMWLSSMTVVDHNTINRLSGAKALRSINLRCLTSWKNYGSMPKVWLKRMEMITIRNRLNLNKLVKNY